MKIQNWGVRITSDINVPCSHFAQSVDPIHISISAADFKSKRENGLDKDTPKNLSLEFDGKHIGIKGDVRGDYIYGVKRPDGNYDYEIRYYAGPKDLAYFEAKDCNYLTRIFKEGNLRKEEPAVWYLYQIDNQQNLNIADWWSQKLKLENIDAILKDAEIAEKEYDNKLMKIQKYSQFADCIRSQQKSTRIQVKKFLIKTEDSWNDFKNKRENGEDQDNPKDLSLAHDGKFTWVKGEVKNDYVYGVLKDGHYDYEQRYDAGPIDLAYFEAKDRNYLTRILKEGRLRKEKPAVRYLFETDNPQKLNIADCWSQKLKLPTEELDKLLKHAIKAEKEYDKKLAEDKLLKEQEEKLEMERQELERIRQNREIQRLAREEAERERQKAEAEAKARRALEQKQKLEMKQREQELAKTKQELEEKQKLARQQSLLKAKHCYVAGEYAEALDLCNGIIEQESGLVDGKTIDFFIVRCRALNAICTDKAPRELVDSIKRLRGVIAELTQCLQLDKERYKEEVDPLITETKRLLMRAEQEQQKMLAEEKLQEEQQVRESQKKVGGGNKVDKDLAGLKLNEDERAEVVKKELKDLRAQWESGAMPKLAKSYDSLLVKMQSRELPLNDDFYFERGSFYAQAADKVASQIQKQTLLQKAGFDLEMFIRQNPFSDEAATLLEKVQQKMKSSSNTASRFFANPEGAHPEKPELTEDQRKRIEEIKAQKLLAMSMKQ